MCGEGERVKGRVCSEGERVKGGVCEGDEGECVKEVRRRRRASV